MDEDDLRSGRAIPKPATCCFSDELWNSWPRTQQVAMIKSMEAHVVANTQKEQREFDAAQTARRRQRSSYASFKTRRPNLQ